MDLLQVANEKFKEDFNQILAEYCEASNSYTLDSKKRERVLQCLRNSKNESSAKFRFWLRSKNFRIFQSADGEEILAMPPKSRDPEDTMFRRVAVVEEFFDIIYAAHSENGHVGQAQTVRAIHAMYALVPRTVIIKFIEMCPTCSKSNQLALKKRKYINQNTISPEQLAGDPTMFAVEKRESEVLDPRGFETQLAVSESNALVVPSSSQEVANALNEILSGKLGGSDLETAVTIEDSPSPGSNSSSTILYSCHLCKDVFTRKKNLQTHIQSHKDFRPSVPLQKNSPAKKRKFNIGFSSPFAGKQRKGGVARKKVIIDLDFSPMAAQAIMLAASRPDIELMAINCVVGRVSVLNACENALRVLKACGRDDVHVCRGAEKSLLGLMAKESNLPGAAWSQKVDGQVQAEHSVSSLIRCVNEHPGEITLVCLGPLTNLALALRLDPFAASHLKDIYIVGGNIEGQGDLSVCAEHNFLFDPEAAHIVLQEMQNAYMLPYEISQRHSIPFEHFVSCLNVGSEKSNFLIESMTQDELQLHTRGVVAPEVFAIAMVIDSTIMLEKEKVYATVELKGEYSRGLMVIDKRHLLAKEPNINIVKHLDQGKTQGLFAAIFSSSDVMESSSPTSSQSMSRDNTTVPVLYRELKLPNS